MRAAIIVAGLLLAAPGLVRAATNCSIDDIEIDLGTVSMSQPTTAPATVTIRCTTGALALLGRVYVNACLLLGPGSGGGSIVPRYMRNVPNDPLEYNIYKDPSFTTVWGETGASRLNISFSYAAPVLGGSGSATTTAHARVPVQPGVAAGEYSSSLDLDTELIYRYSEPLLFISSGMPDSCDNPSDGSGGETGIPFSASVQAAVPNHCEFNAVTDLDFGNVPGLINTPQDQTSSISLSCTGRTLWNVGLDNGQNASGSTRRMRLGTSDSYVDYELYRDPARTQRWGTTINTDTLPGTGTGNPQTVTVYGRVPAGQAVPAGSYRDTVTVTVTY